MAITKNTDVQRTLFTAGAITTTGISVTAGDLIVVGAMSDDGTITVSGISDDDGNSYTLLTAITQGNSHIRMAYAIAANTATVAFTATYAAGSSTKSMGVVTFTPDSGDTVSLDINVSGQGAFDASPWTTGSDTTTGTDEVAIAFITSNASKTYSNEEIPAGTAATVLSAPNGNSTYFYDILTGTATIDAQTDVSADGQWAGQMLAFKSVAGGTTHQLAGSIASQSALTGLLNLTQRLTGSLNSSSNTSGVLRLIQRLSGSLNSSSIVSGTLRLIQRLRGAISSISALVGNLRLIQRLSGTVESHSHLTGNLRIPGTQSLSGSIQSHSHLSGTLTDDAIFETLYFNIDKTENLNYLIDNQEECDFNIDKITESDYDITME